MKNSKELGLLGELKAEYDFIKNGWEVSLPLGDYCDYDLIAIKDGYSLRVQVKSCRKIQNGKMHFYICSRNYHVSKKYTKKEIDCFYLFCLENEEGYLLPIEEATNGGQIDLRISPPKNKQKKKINFAKDFVFAERINKI